MKNSFQLRLLLYLGLSVLAVVPVFLIQELWWLRHVNPGEFQLVPWNELVPQIQKFAWKVAKRILVAEAILLLFFGFAAGKAHALPCVARVFFPLRLGGALACLCFLPIPALDAVARLILPVTVAACFIRLFQEIVTTGISIKIPTPSRRQIAVVIFVFSLGVHLVPWWNVTTPRLNDHRDYLLTGDQPAYLYMADSIVRDRDIDVFNNTLTNGVYHLNDGRHAGGVSRHNNDLRPGTPEYAAREQAFGSAMYSTHRPGTSLLIAPLYHIGVITGDYHRAFSCLLLVLLTALAIRDLTLAACSLTASPWSCLLMGAAVAVCVPVSSLSVAIFPETIMFFIMARMLRLTIEQDTRWRPNAEIALWLSLAPWLQDKYVLWLLPFVAVRVYCLWPRWRAILCSAIPVVISALVMISFNLKLFGQVMPKNSLGRFLPFHESIMAGLIGIWFDWGFGLIMLAPFCLLSLAGIAAWWKNRNHNTAVLAACAISLVAGVWVIGTWWCWWGGFAPPNRFMLTLLPMLALTAMVATTYAQGLLRGMAVFLWCLSAALGIDALLHPELWYSSSFPSSWLAMLTGWDSLAVRFPPFFPGDPSENFRGFLIAAAGVIAAVGLAWSIYTESRRMRVEHVIPAVLLLLLISGLPSANPSIPLINREDIPTRAGILKDAAIRQDSPGAFTLETEWYYRMLHGPLALGIHFLDEHGNMIGQADFDLNDYRNDWLFAAPANREQWATRNSIMIQRSLQPPDGTTAIRISPYNPALARTYINHLRYPGHILTVK